MQKVRGRIHQVLSFFSVTQLLGSLFAPFRQISVGTGGHSVHDQLTALGDRIFSRAIGAVIRLMLIAAGLVAALAVAAFGAVLIIAWPILPILPIIGILLMQVRVG